MRYKRLAGSASADQKASLISDTAARDIDFLSGNLDLPHKSADARCTAKHIDLLQDGRDQ